MMIFFNDPVPVPNPAERAVRIAVAMRDRVRQLGIAWRRRGYDLALGVGFAEGYATIGAIGFEGRVDYGSHRHRHRPRCTPLRRSPGDQILASSRVAAAVEELTDTEEVGTLSLKGFLRPLPVCNVLGLKSSG